MFKSISTQTGNYSYSVDLEFTGYEPFSFGFSGNSKLFSFTGESGKIYDQDSNFVYSYEKNEAVQISGNRFGFYNNYFINNSLFNSNNSQNTGYAEYFYFDGPIIPQLSFNGNQPNYRVASGKFLNGNQTGQLYVYNDGVENFKFYSGNFTGPSGDVFSFSYPFDSGNIATLKTFDINSVLAQGASGKYSVNAEFYTNFGLVNKSFDIYSIFELEAFLSLFGPSAFTETGEYDYTLSYDLVYGSDRSTDPYDIYFEFSNLSGRGDFGLFTGGTGYYTGASNVDISANRTITNSGQLTGLIDFTITGSNPYLGYPYTGTANAIYYSPFQYATGDFEYIYSILATGLSTGFITNNVEVPSGDFPNQPIGFTGELDYGFHIVSGTGLLNLTGTSYYEGQSWEPSFEYTGVLTGEVFSSGTTGIISESGVTNYSTNLNLTGKAFYEYDYISHTNGDLSGYWTGLVFCDGSQGLGYIQQSIPMSGDFYHRVRSELYSIDFNYTFSQYATEATGYTYYTGDFDVAPKYGAYICQCSGTGAGGLVYGGPGVMAPVFPATTTIQSEIEQSQVGWVYGTMSSGAITRNTIFPQFSPDNEANNTTGNAVPLTGTYTTGNPLNFWIGGDPLSSGFALVCDHTNEKFPVLGLSSNDYERFNYTSNTVVLYIEPKDTFGNPVRFRFAVSPRYYASGTGIYQEYKAIDGKISMYKTNAGEPWGSFQESENFSWSSNSSTKWDDEWNQWESFSTTFDENTPSYFVFNVHDDDSPNLAPSGFYFIRAEQTLGVFPGPGFDTSGESYYFGASGIFATTDGTGYGFSEEETYLTGTKSGTLILNDNSSNINFFKSGHSGEFLNINYTGVGYVTGSDEIETGNAYLTGNFTGLATDNFYNFSSGFSKLSINTGIFDADVVYLNYILNLNIEDDPLNGFYSEQNLRSYTIGGTYPTVESISGDLSGILHPLGFSSFMNGNDIVFSGRNTQYSKFGFSLGSSSPFEDDFTETFLDNSLKPIGSQVTGFGSGYRNTQDFLTFEEITVDSTGFISGQWIERDDIPAQWDITRSGDYGIVSTTFTGAALGTGLITGLTSFTINDGSGSYLLNRQETGTISGYSYSPILSSGISITPSTGFLNVLYEGTGYYEKTFSVDVQGSGFSLDIPSYIKTFSGEYEFYTGTTTGSLIQLDYDSNAFLWSGVNIVTGLGEFALKIKKTKEIGSDSLKLFYSGQNNITGGFII